MNLPLQLNTIPYPLWRKRWPDWATPLLKPVWERLYPYQADENPPQNSAQMADILLRFRMLPDMSLQEINAALIADDAIIVDARSVPLPPRQPAELIPAPARLPAQWEEMARIVLTWPIFYMPLWTLHAQMVQAILPVAEVSITVPAPMWANAINLYLKANGLPDEYANRLQFVVLPTDDIWVRDYGPIGACSIDGKPVVFDAIYDHLPHYPQTRDDDMPRYWAAHLGATYYTLDLHTEGGNLWTDGTGTMMMTERIFEANPHHTRASLEAYLHRVFDFEKIIYTPRMRYETTGHIDLLVKLADTNTVFISAPDTSFTDELQTTHDIFRKATNARGEHYNIVTLPTPSLYWNWFAYPIRRSYTNALTVNGRVLVPIYGEPTDAIALRRYEETMPHHQIIPIDCKIGANGGGAVHCLTKEVPA